MEEGTAQLLLNVGVHGINGIVIDAKILLNCDLAN